MELRINEQTYSFSYDYIIKSGRDIPLLWLW